MYTNDSFENGTSTQNTDKKKKFTKMSNGFETDEKFNALTDEEYFPTRRGFGKFKRKLTFFLLFIINLLVNLDHGAIPAGTTELMNDLKIDHVTLGTIGSMIFLGLTLGSVIAGPLFSSYSPKIIVIMGLIISSSFLYVFTTAHNFFALAASRVGCGFFQVLYYYLFYIGILFNLFPCLGRPIWYL
jgi:MFS family permease